MDWHIMLGFALMAAVIEISPGPNFCLITKSVSTVGKTAALANIPGFSAAFMMHGALSIFGVSTIMGAQPSFLVGIQLLGAGYLFYLGVQSILAVKTNQIVVGENSQQRSISQLINSNAHDLGPGRQTLVNVSNCQLAHVTNADFALQKTPPSKAGISDRAAAVFSKDF